MVIGLGIRRYATPCTYKTTVSNVLKKKKRWQLALCTATQVNITNNYRSKIETLCQLQACRFPSCKTLFLMSDSETLTYLATHGCQAQDSRAPCIQSISRNQHISCPRRALRFNMIIWHHWSSWAAATKAAPARRRPMGVIGPFGELVSATSAIGTGRN